MKLSRLVLLTLAGALALSAIVVPSANAQVPACTNGVGDSQISNLNVAVPDQPVRPITDQKTLKASATYTWTAGHSIAPIAVTIKVTSKESYGVVEASPQDVAINIPAPSGSQQGGTGGGSAPINFDVVIKFTREAPAFKDSAFTVTVNAGPGTCIRPPPQATTKDFTLKPDFYSVISASADKAIIKAGQNNEKVIPINVENTGNGPIKVFFEVSGGSSGSKGLKVISPPPETLDSPYSGGKATKKQIPLSINTPYKNGYMNGKNTIDVVITSRSVDKTELEGDKAQLSILVSTQGVYVPGFDSVLMLGALAGAAGLVGYTRRRGGPE